MGEGVKEHHLKTWPAPFAATVEGRKPFEVRKDDRGFVVGDVLVLREWEACGCDACGHDFAKPSGGYTGRVVRRLVTHIERGPSWGLPAGMVVMGLGTEQPKRSG